MKIIGLNHNGTYYTSIIFKLLETEETEELQVSDIIALSKKIEIEDKTLYNDIISILDENYKIIYKEKFFRILRINYFYEDHINYLNTMFEMVIKRGKINMFFSESIEEQIIEYLKRDNNNVNIIIDVYSHYGRIKNKINILEHIGVELERIKTSPVILKTVGVATNVDYISINSRGQIQSIDVTNRLSFRLSKGMDKSINITIIDDNGAGIDLLKYLIDEDDRYSEIIYLHTICSVPKSPASGIKYSATLGGKKTRKQMYAARSRGIITLKNASAFRKHKKAAKGRHK